MSGKADADGHVADGVFEDQVPADNPGDEFAHRGVGVGVGASCDGDHCRKLGVTDRSEATSNGDEDEGKGDGWSGTGTAERRVVMNEILEERSVEDGRGLKFLAGDGCADDGEDARADDGANA